MATIVPKMVDSEEAWDSVAFFIEEVMEAKEEEERRREQTGEAGHALKRPRGRRRRRQPAAIPAPVAGGGLAAPVDRVRARRAVRGAQPAA